MSEKGVDWTARCSSMEVPYAPPPYPSDLTDAEWAVLAPLIPGPKPGGPDASGCLAIATQQCLYNIIKRHFDGRIHYDLNRKQNPIYFEGLSFSALSASVPA